MKQRLIDANALEQTLYNLDQGENEAWTPMEFKDYVLDYQPTVDAEPVVHAHWIDEGEDPNDPGSGNHQYLCSHCGHRDISSVSTEVPHCWFCGARMDEVADG